MRHNIFAYTAPGCNYPAYISVNVDDTDDRVVVTVRSLAKEDGSCGDTSEVKLEPKQLSELARKLFSFACCNNA